MPLDVAAAVEVLSSAGCVAPAEEAEELIDAAGGDAEKLEDLVSRRARGEPLAWLTGTVMFCGIKLIVDAGVYVPRWESQPLAYRAANLLPGSGIAVDLCTGAGAVAAVMSRAAPSARVIGTDLDQRAVECARRNGVEVVVGFLDDPLPGDLEHRVDVLTAIVPYVPTDLLHLLPRDVQIHEPRLALDGGAGGIEYLAEVVARGPTWLKPGGWLLLELGGDQAQVIEDVLSRAGFEEMDVMFDDEGDPRAICARLGPLGGGAQWG